MTYSGNRKLIPLLFRPVGEAGKVEESMAKLEAVEALKSEKAEKEVRLLRRTVPGFSLIHFFNTFSESCNDYPRLVVLQVIRSSVSVKPVVPICRYWIPIVDSPIISVVKCVPHWLFKMQWSDASYFPLDRCI